MVLEVVLLKPEPWHYSLAHNSRVLTAHSESNSKSHQWFQALCPSPSLSYLSGQLPTPFSHRRRHSGLLLLLFMRSSNFGGSTASQGLCSSPFSAWKSFPSDTTRWLPQVICVSVRCHFTDTQTQEKQHVPTLLTCVLSYLNLPWPASHPSLWGHRLCPPEWRADTDSQQVLNRYLLDTLNPGDNFRK